MHERIIQLYEENAAAWDQQRGRELFEKPWMDRFLNLLPEGGSILDVGCGTGEPIARYFIESGFVVTGVDSSPSMIALCKSRFPEHRWLVGDMRKLALGRRFDGIIGWHSFFHLSPGDQRPMFARFAAHSALGGILMITTGPTEKEEIGEWRGEPLYHGSLSQEEYRRRLEENGFTLLANVVQDPECGHATIWIARYRDKDPRARPA
jgi:SAM-dependent methyltransferase